MKQVATNNRISANAIGYSLGFALLWFVVAAVQQGTTFHLAPPLVAVAAPSVYRVQAGVSRSTAIRLAVGGVAVAAAAAVLLAMVGLLDGPSLLPFGGALIESLVGVVTGGLFGIGVAAWPQPASF